MSHTTGSTPFMWSPRGMLASHIARAVQSDHFSGVREFAVSGRYSQKKMLHLPNSLSGKCSSHFSQRLRAMVTPMTTFPKEYYKCIGTTAFLPGKKS